MKIEEAQEMMRKIYLERDRARGVEGTLKRTFDELEELREAIDNNDATLTIADEVADVFAWLCSLANLLEIDVSDAFYKKYSDACSKCKKSPCDCDSLR
jgi:NTP pyrophosphatase (non-canonical NTP hydrolase)